MARAASPTNIYGDVESPEDIVDVNRQIRNEMDGVKRRDQLTELKKRSDYLCALALAPSWKRKFRQKAEQVLKTAKSENRKTVELANKLAERHGWDADYDAWGGEQ